MSYRQMWWGWYKILKLTEHFHEMLESYGWHSCKYLNIENCIADIVSIKKTWTNS